MDWYSLIPKSDTPSTNNNNKQYWQDTSDKKLRSFGLLLWVQNQEKLYNDKIEKIKLLLELKAINAMHF